MISLFRSVKAYRANVQEQGNFCFLNLGKLELRKARLHRAPRRRLNRSRSGFDTTFLRYVNDDVTVRTHVTVTSSANGTVAQQSYIMPETCVYRKWGLKH